MYSKRNFCTSQLLSTVLFSIFLWKFASSQSTTCPQVERCIKSLDSGNECDLLPVIPGTELPAPDPSGYTLTKISNSVYHYLANAYHSVIIYSASTKHLAIVDFPRTSLPSSPSGAFLLEKAVQSITGDFSKIKRLSMIYSHRHYDHIGAADVFVSSFLNNSNTKISVYGTLETSEFIRRHDDNQVPLPTKIIPNRKITKLRIEKKLIVQLFPAGGHTKSDVVTYIPINKNKKLVHFVDIVKPGISPFTRFSFTNDLGRYISVHEELLKIDFNIFSGGHGNLGTKEDVRQNLKFTQFVINAARTALDTVNVDLVFQRVQNPNDSAFGNRDWAGFEMMRLQAKECAKVVIKEWGCILSSVDFLAQSLCDKAMLYLSLEK